MPSGDNYMHLTHTHSSGREDLLRVVIVRLDTSYYNKYTTEVTVILAASSVGCNIELALLLISLRLIRV